MTGSQVTGSLLFSLSFTCLEMRRDLWSCVFLPFLRHGQEITALGEETWEDILSAVINVQTLQTLPREEKRNRQWLEASLIGLEVTSNPLLNPPVISGFDRLTLPMSSSFQAVRKKERKSSVNCCVQESKT